MSHSSGSINLLEQLTKLRHFTYDYRCEHTQNSQMKGYIGQGTQEEVQSFYAYCGHATLHSSRV
jgi:hypothetical protein